MSNSNLFQKPKIDRTKYIFSDKKDEILVKKLGEIEGFNFKIRNLTNCKVFLLDWTTGIFIDDCVNCEFLIGPCDGSVFIRTSRSCKVSIISKQLRFRECHDCVIYTYCPSDPVIEASSNILFAPFNYSFPNASSLFKKANFNAKENNYTRIYDFSENDNKDKLHWRLLERGEFKEEQLDLQEITSEINEYIYNDYKEEYMHLISEEQKNKSSINNNAKIEISNIEEDINISEFINEEDIVDDSPVSNGKEQDNNIGESLITKQKIQQNFLINEFQQENENNNRSKIILLEQGNS